MPKRKTGRPTKYTPELAKTICRRIAAGESLRHICRDDDMPDRTTVRDWIVDGRGQTEDDPIGFPLQYARAREASAEAFEDRVLANCDELETTGITMPQATARKAASELLIRLMALRAPKTHGDLTKLEHTGSGGGPVEITLVRGTPPAKGPDAG